MSTPRRIAAVRLRRWNSVAFTLIEVLVVVAIIALLVAILIPALSRARDQARTTVCASNTHQMGLALHMYTMEHGYYPGHHFNGVGIKAGTFPHADLEWSIQWPVRLLRYVGRSSDAFSCPSAPEETRWNGRDYIVSSMKVAARLTTQFGIPTIGTFSYGYNDWGCADRNRVWPPIMLGLGAEINASLNGGNTGEVKVDRVRMPAEMIAIADNDVDKTNIRDPDRETAGHWDTAIDPVEPGEYPGDRHRKGANVVFADGHAEWIRQAQLISKRPRMRQMWHNDWRDHCELEGIVCEGE